MTATQLVITIVAVVGIIIVGVLAVVPSFLDYPRGHDQSERDVAEPTPLTRSPHSDDSDHDSFHLAA